MIGARPGMSTRLNRLIAHAMASTLTAFVVPDVRIAGCIGLDLPAVGLEVVATPRHAMVLVVIGELPPRLLDAATVVYAQMPRPRFILAMGGENPAPLPPTDVTTSLDQAGLVDGVRRLRTSVSHRSWEPIAAIFTAPALDETDVTDQHGKHGGMAHGEMHHDHDNHAGMSHGGMPQGDHRHAADSGHEMGAPGQDHASPEATGGAVTHDHTAMAMHEHGDAAHDTSSATAAMDQDAGPTEHTAMGHTDHAGHDPMPPVAAAHANHAGMDHGSMPHTAAGDPEQNPVAASHPEYIALPDGAAPWRSDMVQPGGSHSYIFGVLGEYKYTCMPHVMSGMRGTIAVEE